MKKLFLLLTTGVISFGSWAQEKKSSSLLFVNDVETHSYLPSAHPVSIKDIVQRHRATQAGNTQNKPTASTSRIYNYVQALASLNPGISANQQSPYMWFRPDIMGIYRDENNQLIADTIQFASYAALLHPQAPILNDPNYYDENHPAGDGQIIGIRDGNAYTLDSVTVYGTYGRNIDKPSVVDTLRFAFIYGDLTDGSNIPESGFVTGDIRFGAIFHDTIANTGAGIQGGPAVLYEDLYLTAADTGQFGYTVPANLAVPAGNVVAVTVTFKSGEDGNYNQYVDTAFVGELDPSKPFIFGMFRPLFFEENANQRPTHTVGNYNAGYIKYLPPGVSQSWEQMYVPHWAYTEPQTLEYPFVDFHITCASCHTLEEISSVENVSNVISNVSPFPNPAQDFVRIPVTLSKATDVKVSLLNTVGQVLQTQQLYGNAVTAEFNTAGIPSGIYIYSVEADGQRSTGRVSITR